MESFSKYLIIPLGFTMYLCYRLLGNYALAIVLFTLLTKIILLPISIWVHKNSIKIVKIQPEINRLQVKFYGDKDTIAEEQAKIYKREKYNPLASLIPLAIQIALLIGLVNVIYHPLDYLLNLPGDLVSSMIGLTGNLTGADADVSSIQLSVVEAVKSAKYNDAFLALGGDLPQVDMAQVVNDINGLHMSVWGINLSSVPSVVGGVTVVATLLAGLSSWLLCVAQNAMNVLQSEQGKINKYGTMTLAVGLSLYLGYFVPVGIAVYWIFSNLFTILQLVLLNVAIKPRRFVDYQALQDSKREIEELKALEAPKKRFSNDQIAKREKADYKRFVSILNKHIVFYSEKSGFYKYYKSIIEELFAVSNVIIHYVTNDPEDIIFDIAKENPRIKPYYIGVKKLITLMMKIDCDIVVMTTPDLNKFYIKRSFVRKDIEYIFVPHDVLSFHIGFREGALDHFDTIFCSGEHIANEVRATEKVYNLPEKTLVPFGYPLIEELIESYQMMEKVPHDRKEILIAPSWQDDNLLDSCIDELLEGLYCDKYHITVRPHPEYIKRYGTKMQLLCERYADKVGDGLTFELDFSSNKSIYTSDLLITDWSGIAIEFAFSTKKPALFINTKMKVMNPNWKNIGLKPTQLTLRDTIGISVDTDKLNTVEQSVSYLLENEDKYKEIIDAALEKQVYNLGSAGKAGAMYILGSLKEKKKAKTSK